MLGNEELFEAIETDNHKAIEQLLVKNNIDLTASNAQGLTALHLAFEKNNVRAITLLLQRNYALIELKTKEGKSPPFYAKLEILILLSKTIIKEIQKAINQSSDEKTKDDYREALRQAFNSAAAKDRFITIQTLLEHATFESKSDELTALHVAVAHAKINTATILIDEFPDWLEAPDSNGETPLFHAIKGGDCNFEIIKFLIGRGANLAAQDKNGETPLFHAIRGGDNSLKITEFLLDKGANVKGKNKQKFGIFYMAGLSGSVQMVLLIWEATEPTCVKYSYFNMNRGLAQQDLTEQFENLCKAFEQNDSSGIVASLQHKRKLLGLRTKEGKSPLFYAKLNLLAPEAIREIQKTVDRSLDPKLKDDYKMAHKAALDTATKKGATITIDVVPFHSTVIGKNSFLHNNNNNGNSGKASLDTNQLASSSPKEQNDQTKPATGEIVFLKPKSP